MLGSKVTSPLLGKPRRLHKIAVAGRVEQYRQGVEGELRNLLSTREGFLYNLLRYQLGWVDRDGQPDNQPSCASFPSLMAPAVCDLMTGDFDKALPMAAAVELLHNFSQVHGDVQAGRVDASSRPSIWWVWGPAQAINARDGFHAMARVALMRMFDAGVAPDRVLNATEMLDRSCLSMCEGQYADLGFQDKLLVTIGEYEDMVARKAGSLVGCSAAGGALSAGGDGATVENFRDAGIKLGMAHQITQDIADFWGIQGNGITASNVLNKKKSLAVIYTLENCSLAGRREIAASYSKRVLEPPDIERIVDIMEGVNARDFCQQKARTLVSEATDFFDEGVFPGGKREGLRELAAMALSSDTRSSDDPTNRPGAQT